MALTTLSGCDRPGGQARFPADADIATALAADFNRQADTATARQMVQTLGGDGAALQWMVRDVVQRQGVMEAHYDIALQLSRPGAQSLQQLYAGMVPEPERARLPQELAAYEQWLTQKAAAMEPREPQSAAALRATLDRLGKCYRDAKTGDRVLLMEGLVAQLLPARSGWYAEKAAQPGLVLRCLPT